MVPVGPSCPNKQRPTSRIAKHESNQAALERLLKAYEKACERENFNYARTLKRAIKSLAECEDPISTNQEAMQLKFVGSALAKIICPSKLFRKSSSKIVETAAKASKASKQSQQTVQAAPPPALKTNSKFEESRPSSKKISYVKAREAAENLVLPSKDWRVFLVVDGREHKSDHVIAKLQMSGVPSEQRNLPIGDMAWIAKSGNVELMLGTIIERKEVNDLASSLYGTRLLEQRLRLQNCGLSQLLLLVEGDTSDVMNCPADTLHMAMMETRVQLNFQVVHTSQLHETVKFLKTVHRRILQRTFPNVFGPSDSTLLPSFTSPNARRRGRIRRDRRSLDEMVFDVAPKPPFNDSRFITYQELKCRVEKDREEGTRTVHAIHCGMLKQIPSFSHKKVMAVARAYPTPTHLRRALSGLSKQECMNLIQDLDTGGDMKCTRATRIGPNSALEFCQVYEVGENDNSNQSTPLSRQESARSTSDSFESIICAKENTSEGVKSATVSKRNDFLSSLESKIVSTSMRGNGESERLNRCIASEQSKASKVSRPKSTLACIDILSSDDDYSSPTRMSVKESSGLQLRTVDTSEGISSETNGSTIPENDCFTMEFSDDDQDLMTRLTRRKRHKKSHELARTSEPVVSFSSDESILQAKLSHTNHDVIEIN